MSAGRAGGRTRRPRRPREDAGRLHLVHDLGIEPALRRARWADLSPDDRGRLLALRAAAGDGAVRAGGATDGPDGVDPDPVDADPATEHVVIDDVDVPVACLRVRPGTVGAWRAAVVERLCVHPDVRGLGLAGALLTDVVARYGGTVLLADVPPAATGTFGRCGFVPVLEVPVDDAAPVRMRRAPDVPWRED